MQIIPYLDINLSAQSDKNEQSNVEASEKNITPVYIILILL